MTGSRTLLAGESKRELRWLPICGIVMASLTEAIAGTALSLDQNQIIGDTYATPDEFAWLDIGYIALKLIGFAVTPWLLTRVRPWQALLVATLIMGAACTLAALTTQLDVLILMRAVQGLSGAIILVSGQAILFWSYPPTQQPILQALFAMGSVVAPATLAPALQGWLVDNHSWTWIFFIVLPLSLAAAGLLLLAEPDRLRSSPLRELDLPGLALFGLTMVSLTYILTRGSRWDWFQASQVFWLSIIAGASFIMFLVWQRFAAPRTLFDFEAFRTDDFKFAFLVSFIAGAALFGSAFLIPVFASALLGVTPTEAGQLLLPSGALFVGGLLLAAALIQSRRMPPISSVPVGIFMVMIAMWMLSHSNAESGAVDMMPAILLRGLGLGFLFLPITLIAFGKLPAAGIPSGIAIFNIGRQLGGLLGVSRLQTIIDHQSADNLTVLGTVLNQGSPALAERLSSTTAILIARGLDAETAAKAAMGLLARTVTRQATAIAFDTAFGSIALLFVIAAPALITFKIGLARTAGRRASSYKEKAS